MPQEQLKILLTRYRNKLFLQDSFDVEVVLLFNEEEKDILSFIRKFSLSKHTVELEEPEHKTLHEFDEEFRDACKLLNKISGKKDPVPRAITQTIKRKFSIVDFLTYGVGRGYDWVIFFRDDWEKYQPKKKRKFIKPKRK